MTLPQDKIRKCGQQVPPCIYIKPVLESPHSTYELADALIMQKTKQYVHNAHEFKRNFIKISKNRHHNFQLQNSPIQLWKSYKIIHSPHLLKRKK